MRLVSRHLVLGCAALVAAQAQPTSSPYRTYADGLRQRGAQDHAGALATMQALVRAHPDFDRAYYGIVQAFTALRSQSEARAFFERLPAPQACLGLIEVELARQDWYAAEREAARCNGTLPDWLPVYRLWQVAAQSNQRLPALLLQLDAAPPRPARDWAIGWVAQLLSRTDPKQYGVTAKLYLERAAAALPEQDETDEALYFLHRNRERNAEAAAAMERLLARARQRGDEDWIDRAAGRLAPLYIDLQDWPRATQHLETALRYDAEFRRPRAEVLHRTSLGDLRFAEARWTEALTQYQQAWAIETAASDRALLQIKMARAYRERGQFHLAITALTEAETALRGGAAASPRDLAYASTGLARAQAELGDLPRAQASAKRASADVAAVEPGWHRARLLDDLAVTHRQLGDAHKAAQLWSDAAAESASMQDALGELRAHTRRAEVLSGLGQTAAATATLERAAPLIARVPNMLARAEYFHADGLRRFQAADLAGARTALDSALAIGREAAAPLPLSRVHRAMADLLSRQGDLPGALIHRREAVALLESLRAELLQPDDRALLLAHRIDLHRDLVATLLSLGQNAEAFEAAEQGKARAHLDLVSNEPASPQSLPAAERDARQRLATAQLRLLGLRAQTRPKSSTLAAAEAEFEEADANYRRSAAQPVPPVSALRLADVQRVLPAGTLLLHYTLLEEPVVFALSRGSLTTHRLGARRSVEARAARLRTLLAQRPNRLSEASLALAAREAYAALLGPLRARLAGHRELLVVADGLLHYLPFEALIAGQAEGGLREQPFLLRRFAVRYAPSASVLAALETRPRPPHAEWSLLAFGDPRFQSAAPGASERAGFAPLPHSRMEVDQVSRLYAPDRRAVALAGAATESALMATPELSRARVLHFAVHGLLNEARPDYSGLVLSREARDLDDGLLQSYEVRRLRLGADLVVLSACETALGQAVQGEGLVGLTRAFLAAGAASVVASLWRVDDASTSRLMVHLHRNLRLPGMGRAQALRQAQLQLAGSPEWGHPYYWAAFTLTGTTR